MLYLLVCSLLDSISMFYGLLLTDSPLLASPRKLHHFDLAALGLCRPEPPRPGRASPVCPSTCSPAFGLGYPRHTACVRRPQAKLLHEGRGCRQVLCCVSGGWGGQCDHRPTWRQRAWGCHDPRGQEQFSFGNLRTRYTHYHLDARAAARWELANDRVV